MTQAGKRLGLTTFYYVDEKWEMVKQLVKDPAEQSLFLAMWSKASGLLGNKSSTTQVVGPSGLFGNNSNTTQVIGPWNVQDQGKINYVHSLNAEDSQRSVPTFPNHQSRGTTLLHTLVLVIDNP